MADVTSPDDLTDAQIKALRILRDNDPLMPREFAEKMWPDSDGWDRTHHVGHGASEGAMMSMAGGGYLGKLRKRGLTKEFHDRDTIWRHKLTSKGRRLLEEYEKY